jgi:hypothetical protein
LLGGAATPLTAPPGDPSPSEASMAFVLA